MEAGKRTIFDIFNGSRIFELPFFQRPYVWDEPQWERLLEDVKEVCQNKKPYFVGSIILKQRPTSSDERVGDIRVVIDGQQRLTTISILLKVLCLKNHCMGKFDKRFRLDDDNSIVIKHNYNDVDTYNQIMDLENPDPTDKKDRISRAYQYFLDNLDLRNEDFQCICDNLHFVGIDLTADEDEQQIFDTINSLGVSLTTAELLKNYIFGRDDLEKYKSHWRDIFEKDEDTREYWDTKIVTGPIRRTFIDIFFFAFLQIKIQLTNKVSAEDKLSFSKFDRLFESYKDFIRTYLNNNKYAILDELKSYAEVFRKTFNTDILEQELTNDPGTERMNALIFALDTATLIPYILFVECNAADSEKAPLYEYLESYIMRRLVTRMPTNNYNNLFYESLILNRVLTKDALKQYFLDLGNTLNLMPADNDVEQAFKESRLTNKQALGVLYMIESKIRNRAMYSTQLLGISNYSLEHMMPKKWRNNWRIDNPPFTPENRDKVLLTLGNLTIIPQKLNSSVSDADWTTKKNGTTGRNNKVRYGLLKYAEGIETLFNVLQKPEWDEDGIYERAETLSQKALEIWSIN